VCFGLGPLAPIVIPDMTWEFIYLIISTMYYDITN